jgi:putative DNA primase/helicase
MHKSLIKQNQASSQQLPYTPTPDFEAATAFLKALDPGAQRFTFQVFSDDIKAKGLTRVLNGSLDECWEALVSLSARGAGVFVTISKTDLKGRKKTNIIGTRAFFADLDRAPLVNLERLSLLPHIVVETSPGRYHAYWLVWESPVFFKTAQSRLATLLGSDPAVTDPGRVMRLAGFPHQKNPASPFMVKMVDCVDCPLAEGGPFEPREFYEALAEAEKRYLGIAPLTNGADTSPAKPVAASPGPATNAKWDLGPLPAYIIRRAIPRDHLAEVATRNLSALKNSQAKKKFVGERVALETEEAVARAWKLMESWPAGDAPDAGDHAAYQHAAALGDLGLEEATALEILGTWNKRLNDPMPPERIERKIENAHVYRQNPIGDRTHARHQDSSADNNSTRPNWTWGRADDEPPRAQPEQSGRLKELPSGLYPVAPFQTEFLPATIGPWVEDIAERMQCPPDFVGVSATTALGAVLGRKIGIHPMQRNDWYEVPNLWSLIIGRPGILKSPAMQQALVMLHRLEVQAREKNAAGMKEYDTKYKLFKLEEKAAEEAFKAATKAGRKSTCGFPNEPEKPVDRRYITNDTTYEKLGEILTENPFGVLAFRDEIISLFKTLDRDDNAAARGFYLTAWGGMQSYTFDRIIRGKKYIEAACVSMLGACQPGRFAEYLRRAISGSEGDDGMLQRFGLLVWPDQSAEWREVDRYPDTPKRQAAWDTFQYLDQMTPLQAGAVCDQFQTTPCLKFAPDAQEIFSAWRHGLEHKLRSGTLHPALESHFSKYRKLVPALALINHLASGGTSEVSADAVRRAIAYAAYLETHAQRAYASGIAAETDIAKAILARIRKRDLQDGFSARDVYRSQWANLSNREQVQAGLDLLVDYGWLAEREHRAVRGGRLKINYVINPVIFATTRGAT